jgi:hypothetical protein
LLLRLLLLFLLLVVLSLPVWPPYSQPVPSADTLILHLLFPFIIAYLPLLPLLLLLLLPAAPFLLLRLIFCSSLPLSHPSLLLLLLTSRIIPLP